MVRLAIFLFCCLLPSNDEIFVRFYYGQFVKNPAFRSSRVANPLTFRSSESEPRQIAYTRGDLDTLLVRTEKAIIVESDTLTTVFFTNETETIISNSFEKVDGRWFLMAVEINKKYKENDK